MPTQMDMHMPSTCNTMHYSAHCHTAKLMLKISLHCRINMFSICTNQYIANVMFMLKFYDIRYNGTGTKHTRHVCSTMLYICHREVHMFLCCITSSLCMLLYYVNALLCCICSYAYAHSRYASCHLLCILSHLLIICKYICYIMLMY